MAGPSVEAALDAARAGSGRSLREISEEAPLLLVFLRHFG